jgi:hypothetical protein
MSDTDAYVRYMQRVKFAQSKGYSDSSIIQELTQERTTILPRCVMKQATLAMDRNIYKKREAARAAQECIAAIDRIVKELQPKEITA